MSETINVGIIGLGMMGTTHLDVYAKLPGVRVLAVADLDESKRTGKARGRGNIEGQAQGGFDIAASSVRRYADGLELISDPDVHVIDVCVPTPGHLPVGLAALRSGKHVLLEKPLARTYAQARELVDAATAHAAKGGVSMVAMCMRFWPGWDWLKVAVEDGRFGRVRAASFRRVASHPGGPFYSSGEAAGGAALDLHVHDSDFVRHLFGEPTDVSSHGYTKLTGAVDHIDTTYRFATGPGAGALIKAEGCWVMAPGFGFNMQYTVNFENATASFDLARGERPLVLYLDGKATPVELPGGMGYEHEIRYFLDCVRTGRPADRVTLADAAESVRLVERELASIPAA